jgi:hypothetical protein
MKAGAVAECLLPQTSNDEGIACLMHAESNSDRPEGGEAYFPLATE